MSQPTIDQIATKALNSHGFPFQYATVRAFRNAFEQRHSHWAFEVAELPVECNGSTGHLDALYSNIYGDRKYYLVTECKRSNPATSKWVFSHAPYQTRNHYRNEILFDCVEDTNGGPRCVPVKAIAKEIDVVQIGLAANSGERGEGHADTRDIGSSLSQLLRATSGLINYIFVDQRIRQKHASTVFVPALITTAELFVSDANIDEADLHTGKIIEAGPMRRVDWLWFVHNRSMDLASEVSTEAPNDFMSALQTLHSRAVAVISPKGISAFARMNFPEAYF